MGYGNTAGVVYLDFAKAFDSANHRFLLAKPEPFGLCEKSSDGSDPIGREELTVADALSQETKIRSGVHQGLAIGPLLFLVFVNDLPSVITVTTLLFVGDFKIVSPLS